MDSTSANDGDKRAAKRERRGRQPSVKASFGDNGPPRVPQLEQFGEEVDEIRRAIENGSSDDVSRAVMLNDLKLLGRLDGLLLQLDTAFAGQVFEGSTLAEVDIRATTYVEHMSKIYNLIFQIGSRLLDHCGVPRSGNTHRPTGTARGRAKPRTKGQPTPEAPNIQSDPTMAAVTRALANNMLKRMSAAREKKGAAEEKGADPNGPQAAKGTGT